MCEIELLDLTFRHVDRWLTMGKAVGLCGCGMFHYFPLFEVN